ncbi:toxin glutamine deamidase domain-containing protein [Amycolatopsis alba]|uniref:Uncharacterized protein n=1 Tax=Amycolatopsis alba DSM 44262 TaxID=1125972 RepID=A0A229RGQ0_AMYAL|nr:toxin glutamine deamidase domain-containing protein [Amycolatopsis alba]OXM45631.1 hypothetical protein CFP75_30340 [Amycolatopsis alba DSM 44262]
MEDKGPPSGDFWDLILSEGDEPANVYYPRDSAVHAHEKAEAFKSAANHVRQAVARTNDVVTKLHSTAWRDRGGASMRDLVQNNNTEISQIATGLDSIGGSYESYANLLVDVKNSIHDTYDLNHVIYLALGCNLPGIRGFYRRQLAEGVAGDIAEMIHGTAENMLNPVEDVPEQHGGFFDGLWDSAVVQVKALAGLAGFGKGGWSFYNGIQAWGNLGILVGGAALYGLDPNLGKFVDDKMFSGVLGDTLVEFGKNFIAYDQWTAKDWQHALGYSTGNVLGVLGSRGIGAGIMRGARVLGKGAKAADLTGWPKGIHKVGDVVRQANLTGLAKYGLGKTPHVVDGPRPVRHGDGLTTDVPRGKETTPRPDDPGQAGARPGGDPGGTPPPGPKQPPGPPGGPPAEPHSRGPSGPENHPSAERPPSPQEREGHPRSEAPAGGKSPETDAPPRDVRDSRSPSPASPGQGEIQRSPGGSVPEHAPERVTPAADAAKSEALSNSSRGADGASPSVHGKAEGTPAPMTREVPGQADVGPGARGAETPPHQVIQRGDTPPPGRPSAVDRPVKGEPWAEAAKQRQALKDMRDQLDAMAREVRAAENVRAGEAEKPAGRTAEPAPSREISPAERGRWEQAWARLDEIRPRLDELRDRLGGLPGEASASLKLLDELLTGGLPDAANKAGWNALGDRMREGPGSTAPRGHPEPARQRFDTMWRDLDGMKAELDGLLEKAPAQGARAKEVIGPRESAAVERTPAPAPSHGLSGQELAKAERMMKADVEAALNRTGEPVPPRAVSAAERARWEEVSARFDELRPRLDELRDRQGGLPNEASEAVRLLEKMMFGGEGKAAGWRSLDEWVRGETRPTGAHGAESAAKRLDGLWSKLDGVKAELDGLLEKAPAAGTHAERAPVPREGAAPERAAGAGPAHRAVDAPNRPAPEPAAKPGGGGPPVLTRPADPFGIVDAVNRAQELERKAAEQSIKDQMAAASDSPPRTPGAGERARWESARATLDEMKSRFGEVRGEGAQLPKGASDALRLLDEWSNGGLSDAAREAGSRSLSDWIRNETKPAEAGSLRKRFDDLWPNLDGLKAELDGLREKAPAPESVPRLRAAGAEPGLRRAVGDGVVPSKARELQDVPKPERSLSGLPSHKGELNVSPKDKLDLLDSRLRDFRAGRFDPAAEPFLRASIDQLGTWLGQRAAEQLDVGPPTRAVYDEIVGSRNRLVGMAAEFRGEPAAPHVEPAAAKPGTLSARIREALGALDELKAGTLKFLHENRDRFGTDLPAPWSPEALSALIDEDLARPPAPRPVPSETVITRPGGMNEPAHHTGPDRGARPVPGWTRPPEVGRPAAPDVGHPVRPVPGDPELPVPGVPAHPGPGFPEPPSTNPVRPDPVTDPADPADPAIPGAPEEPDRPPVRAPEKQPDVVPAEPEVPVRPLTPFGPDRPGPEEPVRPMEIPPLPAFVGDRPGGPPAPVRPLTPGGRERPEREIPTEIPIELDNPEVPPELTAPDPDVSHRPPAPAPDPRWPFPAPPRASADPEPPAAVDEAAETRLDKAALGLEPGQDLTPEESAAVAARDVQSPELPALRRALDEFLRLLEKAFPEDHPKIVADLSDDKYPMEERVLLAGKYLDLLSPKRPGSHPPDELPSQVEAAASEALARLDRELADGSLTSEEVRLRKEAWAGFTRQAAGIRDAIAAAERTRDVRPLLDELRAFSESLRAYAREHADSAWAEVIAFDLLDPHRMRFLQPSVTADGRFDVATQAIVLHWLEKIFGGPGAQFAHRMMDAVVPWDAESIAKHPKHLEILKTLEEAGDLQRYGVAFPELGVGLIRPRMGMGEFLTTFLHEFTVHLLQEPKPVLPHGDVDAAWLAALIHASHEFQGRSGELLAVEALRAAAETSVVPRELRGEVVPRGLRIPLSDWNATWMKRVVDLEFGGLPEARRAALFEQLRAIGFDHASDIEQIRRAVTDPGHPPILTPAGQRFKAGPAAFAAEYPRPGNPPRPYLGQVDLPWPDPMIDGHGSPFGRQPRHPQRQAPHPQRRDVPAPKPPVPSGLPAELGPLWEALGAEERSTLADLTAEVGPKAGLPMLKTFTTLLARKNGFDEEAGAALAQWLARVAPPTGLPAEWALVWHALPAAAQQAFATLIAAVGGAAAAAELADRVSGLTTHRGGILDQIVELQGHPERFDTLGRQLTESVVPLSAGVPTAVWAVLNDTERNALAGIGRADGLNALGTLAALTAVVARLAKPPATAELPALLASFPPVARGELTRLLANFLGEGAGGALPTRPAEPGTPGPVPIKAGKPVTGKTDPAAVERALWQALAEAARAAGMTIEGQYPRSAMVVDSEGRRFSVILDVAELADVAGQWSVPRRFAGKDMLGTVRVTASSRMPLDAALRVVVHGLVAGYESLKGDRAADPAARFLSVEGNLDAKPDPTPADRGYLAQVAVLGRALDGARWNLPRRFRLRKQIREVLTELGLDPALADSGYRQAALEKEPVRWVVTRNLPPKVTGGYPVTRTHVVTGLITGFLPSGTAAVVFTAAGSPASGIAWGVYGLVNAVYGGFLAREWEIKKDEQVAEGRKYDAKAREIDAAAAPAARARSLLAILGWAPGEGPDAPAAEPVDESAMGPKPDLAQSLRKHGARFSVPPLASLVAGTAAAVPFEIWAADGIGLPSWLSLGVYAVGAAVWLPFAERARTRLQKGAELEEIDKRARGLDKAEADVYAAMGQRLGVERPPGPGEVLGPHDHHLPVPELSVAANLPDFVQYVSEILRRGLRPTAAGTIDNTALLSQHLTLFQGLAAYGAGKSLLMLPIAIWQLNRLDQLELGYTVDRRAFDERDIRRLMRPEVYAERMALLERVEKMVGPARPGLLRRLREALPFFGRPRPEPVRPVLPGEPPVETRPGFTPRVEFVKAYTRLSVGSAGVTVGFVELFGVSPSLALAALAVGFTGPLVGWRKAWHRGHELELGDKDIAETNQGKAADRAAAQTATSAFVDSQVILSAAAVAAELGRASRSAVPSSTTAPTFTAIRIKAHEYPYGDWASAYQEALRELRRSLDAEAARLEPGKLRRDWGDYRTLGERRLAIKELVALAERAAAYLEAGKGSLVWEANADLSNAVDKYLWLNSPEWPKELDPAPNAPRHPGEDPEAKAAEEAAVRHLRYRGGWQGSSDRYVDPLIGSTELHSLPAIHAGVPSAGRYGIARYIREHHPELPRTNPGYHEPDAYRDGYRTNCTRDVVYYVRRQRGEDVTAPPLRPADSVVLGNLAYISDRLGGIWDESHGASYDSVIAAMMDRPSGAMAVLAMEYIAANGATRRHVALVANDDGRIVFLDPQDGWLLSLPEHPVELSLLPFTDVDLPPVGVPKGVQPPRGDLHLPEPELRPRSRVVVVSPEGDARYRSFLELGREQGYNGKDDEVRLGPSEVDAVLKREAAAEVAERGAEAILRESVLLPPPGSIELTDAQWAAVRAVRESIDGFPDSLPSEPVSPLRQEDRELLNELACWLAEAAGGTAGHGDTASVAFDKISWVYQALDVLRERLASDPMEIVGLEDRFFRPCHDGYRDLRLILRTPNGQLVELQLRLKAIEEVADTARELDDAVAELVGRAEEEGRPLSRDEEALEVAIQRRQAELFDEATKRGLPSPPPSEPESFGDAAEAAMAAAEPVGCVEFGDGRQSANTTYHLTYEEHPRTIYKPASGETRALGSHLPQAGQGYRENAMYRLAKAVGSDAVPPTAYIDGPSGPGSSQVWRDDAGPALEVSAYPREQQQLIAFLDYVAASLDRSANDTLTGPAGEAIVIDNGQSFPDYADPLGGIRSGFVAAWFDEPFDADVLAAIRAIDPAWLTRMLVATGIGEEAAGGARDRLEEIQRLGRIAGQTWPARIWDHEWKLVREFK